MRKGKD